MNLRKRLFRLEQISAPIDQRAYVSLPEQYKFLIERYNLNNAKQMKEEILPLLGLEGEEPIKLYIGCSPDDWDQSTSKANTTIEEEPE
jgi:hypothetical protein